MRKYQEKEYQEKEYQEKEYQEKEYQQQDYRNKTSNVIAFYGNDTSDVIFYLTNSMFDLNKKTLVIDNSKNKVLIKDVLKKMKIRLRKYTTLQSIHCYHGVEYVSFGQYNAFVFEALIDNDIDECRYDYIIINYGTEHPRQIYMGYQKIIQIIESGKPYHLIMTDCYNKETECIMIEKNKLLDLYYLDQISDQILLNV